MSVLQLVESLQADLTSEDDQLRIRGVDQLVKAIEDQQVSPSAAAEKTTLLAFLTEKLTDRACTSGALRGCKAIIATQRQHKKGLSLDTVIKLETKLFREVPIASLSQEDRHGSLDLLLELIETYGRELLETGPSVIDGVMQAVDGERDPRCLLLAFSLIEHTVELYSGSDKHLLILEAKAEDLCDLVACYFPITFRNMPENMHGLTREDLAGALERAMSCTHFFAPFIVPLLLEKLSSSIWQAKIDSLAALSTCVERWGWQGLASHTGRIWWALRDELVEPLEPSPAEGSSNSAVAAAACLQRCLAAEAGPQPELSNAPAARPVQSLLDKVIEDDHVADLGQWILESSSAGQSDTALKQFATANTLFPAVCAASAQSCQRLFKNLFGALLKLALSEEDIPASLALSCLLAMFKGASHGLAAWGSEDEQGSDQQSGSSMQACASEMQTGLLQTRVKAGSMGSSPDLKTALLSTKLLAQLASCQSPGPQLLNESQLQSVISALLSIVTDDKSLPAVAEEAALGIAQIAGSGHEKQLQGLTLTTLTEASSRPQQDDAARSPALLCLVQIAVKRPSLQTLILEHLSKAALEAEAGQNGIASASQLDAISNDILPSCGSPLKAQEASAASHLALKLIQKASAWRTGGECSTWVQAAAKAAQACTSRCSAEDQTPIAQEAAAKVAALAGPTDPVLTVAAAAIIALRPGVSVADSSHSSPDALRILMTVSMDSTDSNASLIAMAACSSILLKWPADGPAEEDIDAATAVALDDVILPRMQLQVQQDSLPQRMKAIELLGWVAKALAMRQHPRLAKPLETVLTYLEAASLDLATAEEEGATAEEGTPDQPNKDGSSVQNGVHLPQGEGQDVPAKLEDEEYGQFEDLFDAAEAKAMAAVLSRMMSPGSGLACLDERLHARGRILWQQKTFMTALKGLEEKLEEGVAFLGKPPAPLLLALAHLSSSTSGNIISGVRGAVLKWLLPAICGLIGSPLEDASALLGILRILKEALADSAGCLLLEKKVEELLAGLTAAVGFKADASVRIAGLDCLASAMKLPYTSLHVHVKAVNKLLSQALDDPKRAVRLQAGRTRRLWNPL